MTTGRKIPTAQEKAVRKLNKKSPPKMTLVFNQTMKILEEMRKRLQHAMYSKEYYDAETKKGRHDDRLLKDMMELAKTYKQLGEMHMRIQKQAIAEASQMSFEDRLEAFCSWIDAQGAGNRQKIIPRLQTLLYTLEQASAEWKKSSYETRRGKIVDE